MCSRHSCNIVRIDQAHDEVPVGFLRVSVSFADHTQSHRLESGARFVGKAFNSAPATSVTPSVRGYVPLLFGHLRNTQATLLEDLHVLQDPTILCVLLELLERDHLGKFLDEFDMNKTPLRILTVRSLVKVRMPGVKGGF